MAVRSVVMVCRRSVVDRQAANDRWLMAPWAAATGECQQDGYGEKRQRETTQLETTPLFLM